jgi:broad specificity phosphatase PhoE
MPNLLFRHGQTDKNIRKIDSDNQLTPLNLEGARQADLAGYWLRDYCQNEKITHIQPIISACMQSNGLIVPFLRTLQTAGIMLARVEQFLPDITIDGYIPDMRSRDIKFKKRGMEEGFERVFSDQREIIGESVQSVEERLRDYYHDYLAVASDPGTLVLSVSHVTPCRILQAIHEGQGFDYIEGNIPALNNVQGFEFTLGKNVESVFEGFPLDDGHQAA